MHTQTESSIVDNNVLLESIVNSIFNDGGDTGEADQPSGKASSEQEFLCFPLFSSRRLSNGQNPSSPESRNIAPIKLTQQQLLLLNSFSNRLNWLFDDLSKSGVPMQMIQPHFTSLQRMVTSSREVQFKIQSYLRRHSIVEESPTDAERSPSSSELQAAEQEKTRLQQQIDSLNDKLKFFSSEYQRITELYLEEKSRNEQVVKALVLSPIVFYEGIKYVYK